MSTATAILTPEPSAPQSPGLMNGAPSFGSSPVQPFPSPGKGLYSTRDMLALLSISESSFKRLCHAGRVPPPVRLGRSVRWKAREIDLWVADGCLPPALWKAKQQQDQKQAG